MSLWCLLSSHMCTGIPYNHAHALCENVPPCALDHPPLDQTSNSLFLCLPLRVLLPCPSPDRPSIWAQTLAACREKEGPHLAA